MSTPAAANDAAFAARVLAWFRVHGRRDLPWQRDPTPSRVWVSEIMLQQTQVATVVPYFERFVARFPTLSALAAADLDDVLALWSGLGYYARARNLHRAARIVVARHGGELPTDHAALIELPGIGRSTGAAILALSSGAQLAILDGNVKRVLARYHAIDEWPGAPRALTALWEHAERHMPATDVAAYTQAMMDLGATLCTRAKPRCAECPLETDCEARARGLEERLPAPRPKRARPARAVTVLVVRDGAGRVLLERRPEHGIWGGLYSFPELAGDEGAAEWCRKRLGAEIEKHSALPPVAHAFTHFDLRLDPVAIDLSCGSGFSRDGLCGSGDGLCGSGDGLCGSGDGLCGSGDGLCGSGFSRDSSSPNGARWLWHDAATALPGGIPAPIAKILRSTA
jgi:A/G-specific adenine glycosylase